MFTFPVGFFGRIDPYWDNVVLSLPMAGINGATTFADVSSAPKTVTVNGNAQISTTQSKFGGSSAFSGTTGYLTVSHSELNLSGTSAFTIECWMWLPSAFGTTFLDWIGTRSSNNRGTFLFRGSTLGVSCFLSAGGVTWEVQIPSLSAFPTDQWVYLACTKNGSIFSFWINGNLQGSVTSGVILASQSGWALFAGTDGGNRSANIYIDEVRITKGVARDVSVVPTAPFPVG